MRRDVFGLVVIAAMSLTSCVVGSAGNGTTTSAAPGFTGTTLSTLPDYPDFDVRAGVITSLTTTNIWALYGETRTVYDALVLQGQPAFLYTSVPPSHTQIPWLAADLAPPAGNADGDRWTIDVAIRDDVLWSDGEPVDASDIVFTFETVRTLGLGGGFTALWPVAGQGIPGPGLVGVEAVDAHTVRFTWDSLPGIAVWQHGVGYAPIMPEHFWSDVVAGSATAQDLYAANGDGAPSFGSMVMSDHTPGESVFNTANDEFAYRGTTFTVYGNGAVDFANPLLGAAHVGGDPSGEPLLEFNEEFRVAEMPVRLYVSRDQAAADLIDGQIGLWSNPLPMWPDLGSLRRKFTEAGGITNVSAEPTTVYYLGFNTRRFPGSDPAFRRAIDCMIHKEFIADEYMANAVTNIDSMVLPSAGDWHDVAVAATCAGMSKGEKMNAAVQILEDGGWTWEQEPEFDPTGDLGFGDVYPGSGLRGPNGEQLERIAMTTAASGYDPIRATYSLWVQVYISELGIPITAVPTDLHTQVDQVSGLDWDVYVGGWAVGDSMPTHLVTLFHSMGDSARGGSNTTGFDNREFDDLAERFLSAHDREEALALAYEMQRLISTEVPVVALYTTDLHFSYRVAPESPFPDLLHLLRMGSGGLPGLVKRS